MKQKIFKSKVLEALENDILVNKEYYVGMEENPHWLEESLKATGNYNYSFDTQLEYEPFELVIGDAKTDVENAKRVYSHYMSLTPVQAVKGELWTYMTHIQFPEYMATRWNIKSKENSKDIKTVIEQRYFAIRGSKGIMRNGIARLWWAGYWGYDERRKDPFELVEVILGRQEVYEHISERSYNRNKNILIASLEAVKENNYDTRKVRALYGKINSYGSDNHLDALNYEEAKEMVNMLVKEIENETEE